MIDDLDLEEALDGIGEMVCPWDGERLDEITVTNLVSEGISWPEMFATTWRCATCGAIVTSPQTGWDSDAA